MGAYVALKNFSLTFSCFLAFASLSEQLLQGGDDSAVESDNFDWNTEDELEIENYQSSSSCLTVPNGDAVTGSGEVSFFRLFSLQMLLI